MGKLLAFRKPAKAMKDMQTSYDELIELYHRSVGMAFAKQCAFADTIATGYWQWQYGLDGCCMVIDVPNQGRFPSQVLGTECHRSNTWMFASTNKHLHENMRRAVSVFCDEMVQKERHQLFSHSKLPLDCINGDFVGVIASCSLEGNPVYLRIPNSEYGHRYDLVFYVPFINMDPMPPSRIATVIIMMLQSKAVMDVWYAIDHFLLPQGFKKTQTRLGDHRTDAIEYTHADGRSVSLTSAMTDQGQEEIQLFMVSEDGDMYVQPEFNAEPQWQWVATAPLDRLCSLQFPQKGLKKVNP